MHIHVK